MEFLAPLGLLFGSVVRMKNAFYNHGWLKSHELPVRVVSVGNLSVGGTGKTSFVLWLLNELQQRNIRVGVVSRGYGGQTTTPAQVPVNGDPRLYGDEPCLIANDNKGPVYVGSDRVAVGLKLLEEHPVDVVIADDAFQHRRLYRDMDVVLIDFSEAEKNWRLLPQGRLREDFSALKRAQVIVSTKKKFSEMKDFSRLEKRLPPEKVRLSMEYVFNASQDSSGKYLLVSGVAKPQGVEMLARAQMDICDHLKFGDHFDYTEKDAVQILEKAKQLGAAGILTTEKDAVKLRKFPKLQEMLKVMKLQYSVEGQVNEFFKILLGENI